MNTIAEFPTERRPYTMLHVRTERGTYSGNAPPQATLAYLVGSQAPDTTFMLVSFRAITPRVALFAALPAVLIVGVCIVSVDVLIPVLFIVSFEAVHTGGFH